MTNPTQLLYHGTSFSNSTLIEQQGLLPKNYDKVYLTTDIRVAYNYAKSRNDQPVICIVDAPQMVKDGFTFDHNNTYAEWTTDSVPEKYLIQLLIEDESDLDAVAFCVS